MDNFLVPKDQFEIFDQEPELMSVPEDRQKPREEREQQPSSPIPSPKEAANELEGFRKHLQELEETESQVLQQLAVVSALASRTGLQVAPLIQIYSQIFKDKLQVKMHLAASKYLKEHGLQMLKTLMGPDVVSTLGEDAQESVNSLVNLVAADAHLSPTQMMEELIKISKSILQAKAEYSQIVVQNAQAEALKARQRMYMAEAARAEEQALAIREERLQKARGFKLEQAQKWAELTKTRIASMQDLLQSSLSGYTLIWEAIQKRVSTILNEPADKALRVEKGSVGGANLLELTRKDPRAAKREIALFILRRYSDAYSRFMAEATKKMAELVQVYAIGAKPDAMPNYQAAVKQFNDFLARTWSNMETEYVFRPAMKLFAPATEFARLLDKKVEQVISGGVDPEKVLGEVSKDLEYLQNVDAICQEVLGSVSDICGIGHYLADVRKKLGLPMLTEGLTLSDANAIAKLETLPQSAHSLLESLGFFGALFTNGIGALASLGAAWVAARRMGLFKKPPARPKSPDFSTEMLQDEARVYGATSSPSEPKTSVPQPPKETPQPKAAPRTIEPALRRGPRIGRWTPPGVGPTTVRQQVGGPLSSIAEKPIRTIPPTKVAQEAAETVTPTQAAKAAAKPSRHVYMFHLAEALENNKEQVLKSLPKDVREEASKAIDRYVTAVREADYDKAEKQALGKLSKLLKDAKGPAGELAKALLKKAKGVKGTIAINLIIAAALLAAGKPDEALAVINPVSPIETEIAPEEVELRGLQEHNALPDWMTTVPKGGISALVREATRPWAR